MNALILFSCILTTCFVYSSAIRVCLNSWLTDVAAGADVDDESVGTACSRTLPIASQCPNSINPVCEFSFKMNSYRCCGDVNPTKMVTLPGTAKPKCPNGGIPYGRNSLMPCDPLKIPCPTGYSCIQAANVQFDQNGVLTPEAAGTAGLNRYLCCKTTSLSGNTAEGFTSSGLVPSIVPIAPKIMIDTVELATANYLIGWSDDWSALTQALSAQPTKIHLQRDLVAGYYYHAIIFDATTNKDVIYFGVNIVAAANPGKILTLPAATAGTAPALAFVYNNPASPYTNKYNYNPTYKAPTQNTSPHQFVALVWETPIALQLAAAGTVNSPLINMNGQTEKDSDFVPVGTGNFGGNGKSGVFTTVTAFLNGKGRQLGTPIAGTYFYLKN